MPIRSRVAMAIAMPMPSVGGSGKWPVLLGIMAKCVSCKIEETTGVLQFAQRRKISPSRQGK
jgi:hypothetical protein